MGQMIIQVDAFTDKPFTGNPAAVCILSKPLPAEASCGFNLIVIAYLLFGQAVTILHGERV